MSRYFQPIAWLILIGRICPCSVDAAADPRTPSLSKGKQCAQEYSAQLAPEKGPNEITDPWVKKWLSLVEDRRRALRLKKGDWLKIGAEEVRIVEPLGKGIEGEVYLVRTKDGLRVAKVFHTYRQLRANLLQSDRLRRTRRDLAMPRTLRIDRRSRTVLMEYIEGVPVSHLKQFWEELGLAKEQLQAIEEKSVQAFGKDYNQIYSVKESRVYTIDIY